MIAPMISKLDFVAVPSTDAERSRAFYVAKGVEFAGDTIDTGVCHMAFFTDPDGNDLMLHHRYKPYS